jgi:SAM-dependent methyltransferase
MRAHDVRCTPQEFQAAVNVTFHRFESGHYDDLHQDMWESLPAQIALLAEDCLRAPGVPEKIRMLDIGCGTGLATELLLRSPLGKRVVEIDLLDTSPQMLERAKQRHKQWGKTGESRLGLVEDLPHNLQYDLVITCSVLHHVPDLAKFLGAVADLQRARPNALFLHLQDPNGDALNSPELEGRKKRLSEGALPEWAGRLAPSRILGRIRREFKGEQGQDYISKTIRELVDSGITPKPLSPADLYAITDIHVHDGGGISVANNKAWLPDYDLVSQRTYAFFGVLASTLSGNEKAEEERLIEERSQHGEYLAAAWRRK